MSLNNTKFLKIKYCKEKIICLSLVNLINIEKSRDSHGDYLLELTYWDDIEFKTSRIDFLQHKEQREKLYNILIEYIEIDQIDLT